MMRGYMLLWRPVHHCILSACTANSLLLLLFCYETSSIASVCWVHTCNCKHFWMLCKKNNKDFLKHSTNTRSLISKNTRMQPTSMRTSDRLSWQIFEIDEITTDASLLMDTSKLTKFVWGIISGFDDISKKQLLIFSL